MHKFPGWLKAAALVLCVTALLYGLTLVRWGKKAGAAGAPLDPVKIRIESSHGPLTLAKEESVWRVTEPVQGPADEDAVLELISALKSVDFKDAVTSRAESHGQYELTEQAARVSVWGAGAVDPWVLAIGKSAAASDWSYVAVGGRPEVFLAGGLRRESAARRLAAWRQRRLLKVPAGAEIQRVSVVRGKKSFVIEKTSASWTVGGAAAAEDKVGDFMSALRTLEAEDLADALSPEDAAKTYGFGTPTAVFEVAISSAAPVVLTAGKKDAAGRTPLLKAGDPVVYLVAGYRWSPLDKESKDFSLPKP